MTILDWRRNPERLSLALEALMQPAMREMLAVMESESPDKHERALVDGFAATRAIGQIEGFRAALNMLRSFAEPLPTAPEDVATTWNVGLPDDNDSTTVR